MIQQFLHIHWPTWIVVISAIAFVILPLIALVGLRERTMDELTRFLWTALILLIPFMGSIAFLIVHPGDFDAEPDEEQTDKEDANH